jgi:hypothetical protein
LGKGAKPGELLCHAAQKKGVDYLVNNIKPFPSLSLFFSLFAQSGITLAAVVGIFYEPFLKTQREHWVCGSDQACINAIEKALSS